jgi:hypothetical protein
MFEEIRNTSGREIDRHLRTNPFKVKSCGIVLPPRIEVVEPCIVKKYRRQPDLRELYAQRTPLNEYFLSLRKKGLA